MGRPRLAGVMVLMLLLVAACTRPQGDARSRPSPEITRSGDQKDDPDPAQPTNRATGIEPPAPTGKPAGQVVAVIESLARVEGKRIGGGHPLYAGSEMTTDVRGRATFKVGEVLEDCQVQTKSRLKVAPGPKIPLDLEEGSIICRSKPGTEEFEVPAGKAVAAFLDPIFLIDVRSGQTEVRVDYGFVQVRKSTGAGSLLVGPGAGLVVGTGDLPDRAEPFDAGSLDQFDAGALSRMRNALPKDPRGLPKAGASQALERIGKTNGLNAGFDESGSRGAAGFGREVLRLLAGSWEVSPAMESVEHNDASWMLQQGVLDAFISPEPVDGATGIALFDEGGRLWSLWVRPDEAYQTALERSVVTILNNGDYGKAYLGAFGQVPIYEAVRSLVYPTSQETGPPKWSEPSGAADPPPQAQIGKVSLSSGQPDYLGPCPHEVTFSGEIEVLSPGTIDYEFIDTFFPEGGFSAGPLPQSSGTLVAKETGTVDVEALLQVKQDGSGWMNLSIPSKGLQSSKAPYDVDCQEDLI